MILAPPPVRCRRVAAAAHRVFNVVIII